MSSRSGRRAHTMLPHLHTRGVLSRRAPWAERTPAHCACMHRNSRPTPGRPTGSGRIGARTTKGPGLTERQTQEPCSVNSYTTSQERRSFRRRHASSIPLASVPWVGPGPGSGPVGRRRRPQSSSIRDVSAPSTGVMKAPPATALSCTYLSELGCVLLAPGLLHCMCVGCTCPVNQVLEVIVINTLMWYVARIPSAWA